MEKYYVFIKDNRIIGCGQFPCESEDMICSEVKKEIFDISIEDKDRYIWSGEEVILNPNYEEEQASKERERIGRLKVTKRVFALALQKLGISYSQLKELISSDEQAQLEWDLCVELQRNNPLLDIMAAQLGISAEMLDNIFKRANEEEI